MGAAFVPATPLLVPEVAQGAAAELEDLRAACRTAIKQVTGDAERIAVIGSGPQDRSYPANARGTLAGFGVALEIPLGSDEPGPVELPPALTIGAWLVRDALGAGSGTTGIAVADGGDDLPDFDGRRLALVVVGDGSARRSTEAPGYFDERAAAFDATVATALADGEPDQLHLTPDFDPLAEGIVVWNAVAWELEGPFWNAELLYDAAPYGVGYFVAAWLRLPPPQPEIISRRRWGIGRRGTRVVIRG